MEKWIYKECITLRKVDLSNRYPYNCRKSELRLRDFSVNRENFISPHPTFLKYYSEKPYWVQITDEDDWIGQKEFENLSDAQYLFEQILNSHPEDIYKLLDF